MKFFMTLFLYTLLIANPIIGKSLKDCYFDHITIEAGLSQNYVTAICQDKNGITWIGTKNGLNKYDGYEIIEYSHQSNNKSSISSNYIETLFVDSRGDLWVGTECGLSRYISEKDNFESFNLNKLTKINCIYEDKNNELWIGTESGELLQLDNKRQYIQSFTTRGIQAPISAISSYSESLIIGYKRAGIKHFDTKRKIFYTLKKDLDLRSLSITNLNTDSQGILWIATQSNGLFKYGNSYESLKNISEVNRMLENHSILDMSFYADSSIVLATEGKGLIVFNPKSKELYNILPNEYTYNLNSKTPVCIYTDSSGILWIGTTNGGINKYDPNKNRFEYYSLTPGIEHKGLNSVYTIWGLDESTLLAGTDSHGLCLLDTKTNRINNYNKSSNLSETSINTIFKDSRGLIWIGAYQNSLHIIGPERICRPINKLLSKYVPPKTSVKYIAEDSEKNIWIGLENNLLCYSPNSNSVKSFKTEIGGTMILNIYEDENHLIWIGTINGLYQYVKKEDKIKRILLPQNVYSTSFINAVIPLCAINKTLWIGTRQGLIQYKMDKNQYRLFTQVDHLPSDNIRGLLHDKMNNNLWISTDKGLCYINLVSNRVTKFGIQEGIAGCEFNDMSFYKSTDGKFYFGSINGIYGFNPSKIKTNTRVPKALITGYHLYHDKSKGNGTGEIQYIPISSDKEIIIPANEPIFSLKYVGINYTNTNNNQYAYKLDGYDSSWKYVGKQRMATYTNLNPGTYTFKVIASNNDGIWDQKGSSIKITILPPWWKSPLAYILYLITTLLLVMFITRFYLSKLKMKIQLENEQFKRTKLEEVDQLKTQFFSNITHELRTPLTLIISPLEAITKNENISHKKEYINTVLINAHRLLALVNQLLDFSKVESEMFRFIPQPLEIIPFVKNEIQCLMPIANEKKIEISFNTNMESVTYMADPAILERIMYNLLSNAIKFTPVEKLIDVNLRCMEESFQLTIKDQGKGISSDKLDKIFESFYQINEDILTGTGIGLSLTKKLVELHGGTIHVESTLGKESIFTVIIPSEKMYVDKNDNCQASNNFKNFKTVSLIQQNEKNNDIFEIGEEMKIGKRFKILIVEDNFEIRKFINDLLSTDYETIESSNGAEAFELARKHLPDVIVSDILMPESDGKELCLKIKQDIQTSHIPFIMLTALFSENDQIEGLSMGADDYITKPFNPEVLKFKIKTAIRNRHLTVRQYVTSSALAPEDVVTEDKDTEFLLEVIQFIKQNITNVDLKVDDLSRMVGMSRTPFYNRIKNLTGMSPNGLIKNIRLNQAAKYLSESDLNIAEITYQVGFSSPIYFRGCFKKQYNLTPSEFIVQTRTLHTEIRKNKQSL